MARNEHRFTDIYIYSKDKVGRGKQELVSDLKALMYKKAIEEQLPDFRYIGRELLQCLPVRMKRSDFSPQHLG